MQTLTVRTMAESGEAVVRFRPRPADAGLRIPLQLQMLEVDFLDQARTMGLAAPGGKGGFSLSLISLKRHPGGFADGFEAFLVDLRGKSYISPKIAASFTICWFCWSWMRFS